MQCNCFTLTLGCVVCLSASSQALGHNSVPSTSLCTWGGGITPPTSENPLRQMGSLSRGGGTKKQGWWRESRWRWSWWQEWKGTVQIWGCPGLNGSKSLRGHPSKSPCHWQGIQSAQPVGSCPRAVIWPHRGAAWVQALPPDTFPISLPKVGCPHLLFCSAKSCFMGRQWPMATLTLHNVPI